MKTLATWIGGTICVVLALLACSEELPTIGIFSSMVAFCGVLFLVVKIRNYRPRRHFYEPFNRR